MREPKQSFGRDGAGARRNQRWRRPPRSARAEGPPRDARDAAYRRLAEQAERFPDLGIEGPETAGLDERDAALAHAIYDGAVRRWLTLRFLLEAAGSRPLETLEPGMRAVLLGGAVQILLMDRVPLHAAINESVEWAKGAIRPGAAGMVNAVLRRVAGVRESVVSPAAGTGGGGWGGGRNELPLGDGRAVRLRGEMLPEDELGRLAVATSHPAGLLRRWSETAPERVRELALHSLVSPPVVLNTSAAAGPLPTEGERAPLAAHESPGHHVFQGTRGELVSLLSRREDLWVQDAASSRAVMLAADLRPRVVVDLCAGQGTKTRQIVSVFGEAQIVASDAAAERARTLAGVFRASERVRVVGVAEVLSGWRGRADLVLLDVPCSNTGVLARRAEAKYRCDPETMGRLVEVQRQILRDGASLLTPGGAILYSTCSIERAENEEQAAWAGAALGLRAEREERTWPRGLPGEPAGAYRDGSYAVLLRSAGA